MIYWWFWGYKTFTGPRANLKSQANDSTAALEDVEKEK